MPRYWASWYTKHYDGDLFDEETGEGLPPFQYWCSGQTFEEPSRYSMCALIDARDEDELRIGVEAYFSDYEERFIEEREHDAVTGSRFPGFENRTGLVRT